MKKVIILISMTMMSSILFGCSKPNKDIKDHKEIQSQSTQQEQLNDKENQDIVKETITEERKTIVIDPGHSSVGNKEKEPIAPNSEKMKTKDVLGATGISSKVPEHITVVSISNILKQKLIDMGYEVIMTKDRVEQSLSNVERAKIGNEANADLVVRIHADSSESQSVHGASILVPPKNEYTSEISDVSREYGEKIINTYTQELNIKNRGVIYRDDMTGFNWSKVPVVILEMGFLSNKDEDIFLSDEKNHNNIADSIANGIKNALK